MPWVVVAVLVSVVHLATGIAAWTEVGLLADDREMIGAAILRHRGDWTLLSAFFPVADADATRALYRPFIDLLFWLEHPWFGIDAVGYHFVNSVMHCATALLWFGLVRRLSGSVAAGLATAVLFVGWPGHSEVTHWIAARVTLQSVFFLSVALLLHDVACTSATRLRQWSLLVLAAGCACVAVGSKESAIFVGPLAAVVSWFRSDNLRSAIVRTLPMAVALIMWFWWRAHCLGTWGSGTHYGWRLERVGYQSCTDWLAVLFAPVHKCYLSDASAVPLSLWLLHGAGLLVALCALRHGPARRVLALGGTLLGLGYLAGIGLEKLHVDVLQNVRYSYEPVLGLCAMLGVGIATLPTRLRGGVLAVLVLVHALVLNGNRQSWLRASSVYQRMHGEIVELARATQKPVRVFDAPGVYEGAFAYLNGYTEFLFWQQMAAPGVNLRGAVSSTQEWRAVLRELAGAAQAKQPVDARIVNWQDGTLQPFELDTQWPAEPFPSVQIRYARVARQDPFERSMLPVHVMLLTSQRIELRVVDTTLVVEASDQPQSVKLLVPVQKQAQLAIELQVRLDGDERRYALGTVSVVPR